MSAALANGLAGVLSLILNMVQLLVIASIIVSWVGDPNNQIVRMINQLTDPIYRPIRKFTSRLPGPFDWAPLVVIAIVVFIERSLGYYLLHIARTGR